MKNLQRPRVLAFDPRGTLVVSNTGAGTIIALPDADGDGAADSAQTILSDLDRPHGITFRGNDLFVAETSRVVRYRYDAATRTARDPKTLLDLPAGGSHTTRTIVFGQNGKLYVSIGSSCNVCRETDQRRAAILEVDPDTGASTRWAQGLRNTVFFIVDPSTGRMLGNDMGRDLLGDNLPPDELNELTSGDYGWPFCYGKQQNDPFGRHPQSCAATTPSLFDYPAHVAPLGLQFIPRAFSSDHAGDLLVAFHGSWNSSVPVGYKIVRVNMENGTPTGMQDFMTGFLSNGKVLGRPVDLLFSPDGILYVTDDQAGAIYRITKSAS